MENKEIKVQEIQMLEQNLQNLLLQKQAFNMELSETKAAAKEIENAGDDVFKIIGQLMIKSDKSKVKEELSNKERLLELRVKSLEKQELVISTKIDSLRKELFG